MRTELHYLGDSISVKYEDGLVVLWRDSESGKKTEIQLDPLVLQEFMYWIEDNGIYSVERNERVQVKKI